MSYQATIAKALGRLGHNGTENPDAKHNQGRLLGEAFMWTEVEKYAKAKADAAFTAMEKEGLVPAKSSIDPGTEQEVAYSPSFVMVAKATQPVKRFNVDELAKLMKESKYKVPESTTKEFIDMAKLPTKPMVSMKIIERS